MKIIVAGGRDFTDSELVAPDVKRIRLHEALGALLDLKNK